MGNKLFIDFHCLAFREYPNKAFTKALLDGNISTKLFYIRGANNEYCRRNNI